MMRRLIISSCALMLVAVCIHGAYSPATTNGWFITTGRVAGLGGSLFRTDLWLFNPDDAATVTLTLVFHPAVGNGQSAAASISSSPVTLAPSLHTIWLG